MNEKLQRVMAVGLLIIFVSVMIVTAILFEPTTPEELEKGKQLCKEKDLNYLKQTEKEVICYGKDGRDTYSFKR